MINLRWKIMCEKVDWFKEMMYFFPWNLKFYLKFNLIRLENKKWHEEFKKKKERKIVQDYMQEKKKEKGWNTIGNRGRKKKIGWNQKIKSSIRTMPRYHADVVSQRQNNGYKFYYYYILELMKNEKR